MIEYRSVEWSAANELVLLDQRKLPISVDYITYKEVEGVASAICNMVVRGAPAIGAAAAYGLALSVWHSDTNDLDKLHGVLKDADNTLRKSRPTAVNLFWSLDQVHKMIEEAGAETPLEFREAVLSAAHQLAQDDIRINKNIGRNALGIVPRHARFLHHCNTGGLATVEYGTALGIIRTAHERGRDVSVLVDETRPRLQGTRLTSWELQQLKIPHRVIVDGASGYYMRKGEVDLCVVGCDRVAANGDVANKIGTYNLALVARAHRVPFYVAAPTSTIDMSTPTGDDIEIEERGSEEITHVGTERIAPPGTAVGNPAFDITPAEYITAIITERGIVNPPFQDGLRKLFA